MEERRLLNAFLLTFLVLMVYYAIFPPRPAKPPEGAAARPTATLPAAAAGAPVAGTPAAASPSTPAVEPVAAANEYRVDVETPDIVAGFKNRGAQLISLKTNKFRDEKGTPEEMVKTTPGGPLPFDIETGDAEIDGRLKQALFRTESEQWKLAAADEASVVFTFAEKDLEARKEFRFRGTGYLIGVSVSVRHQGRELPKKVLWGPGVGLNGPAERAVQGFQEPSGVVFGASGVQRLEVKKLAEGASYTDVQWCGIESRHFAAIWIPAGGHGPAELRAVELAAEGTEKARPASVASVVPGVGTDAGQIFVGPKDYYLLKGVGHELVQVVPVGEWIGPIVVFMMSVLRWLHGHVGNWGWSIVVLTVMISALMAPLRHYGIANGRKMAKISPEMKVIQERYRKVPFDKRQDMQTEMAALYAKHGMSMSTQMVLGCLPILITMPFLIAVYRVLNVSIDLRGAEFLWMPDLSSRDPLFLTPLITAVSLFLTQRLTPTSMDPAQQRMMMLMPIVLMVISSSVPGGVNLYWAVSNICSILQQLVTLRILQAQEASAKRKVRK